MAEDGYAAAQATSGPDFEITARGTHDGLSRALAPPHTRYDDAFVAAATGQVNAKVDTVRLVAVDAVGRAIRPTVARAS